VSDSPSLRQAHQVISLARTAYETGSTSLLDMLDSERSLIDSERLTSNLESTRDKRLVEIEAIDAINLDASRSQQTSTQ
jgi:outer membrane protein TolC